MPTIAKIGNIKIQIFASDHNPPHFHVVTAEYEVLIAVSNFTILRGSIRRRDLDIALQWARVNRETLKNEWKRLNG